MRVFPEPSVRVAEEHPSVLVGAGRGMPKAGGMLWGGDDRVEAEHRDEQHAQKGDCKQESV